MEVRYVTEISPGKAVVRHETYLDYGPEEAVAYVEIAAALDEVGRLDPAILSCIDPQAFWSAIAHIDDFYSAVKALNNDLLSKRWKNAVVGLEKSKSLWREVAEESNVKLSPSILAGESFSNWTIQSKEEHQRIASGCSNIAFLMMMSNVKCETSFTIDMLDFYRGTQIADLVVVISSTGNKEGDRASSIKASLEEAGYGNGAYLSTDPLEFCLNCGETLEYIKTLRVGTKSRI